MAIKFDELLEALNPSLDKFEEDLDSMWIIIPTERRYDDLTASEYLEFARKYGTFNNQKDCFDKIEELAPDRWDAFIPMKLEGVNESLKEDYLDPYFNEMNESLKDKNSFIDWLSEHEQAYKDACNYFHTDNLSLIDAEKLEDWLYDHEQLAKDYSNHFNESLNEACEKELKEDFDSEGHISKISFDIQYVGDGDENDAIDYIEEILNGFEWELENTYDDIELLGSDVENMTEVYQQQYQSSK